MGSVELGKADIVRAERTKASSKPGILCFSCDGRRQTSARGWIDGRMPAASPPALGRPREVYVTVAAIEANIPIHLQIGIVARQVDVNGPGVSYLALVLRDIGNRQGAVSLKRTRLSTMQFGL